MRGERKMNSYLAECLQCLLHFLLHESIARLHKHSFELITRAAEKLKERKQVAVLQPVDHRSIFVSVSGKDDRGVESKDGAL